MSNPGHEQGCRDDLPEKQRVAGKKMGQKSDVRLLPHTGSIMGLISNQFIADLQKIARI